MAIQSTTITRRWRRLSILAILSGAFGVSLTVWVAWQAFTPEGLFANQSVDGARRADALALVFGAVGLVSGVVSAVVGWMGYQHARGAPAVGNTKRGRRRANLDGPTDAPTLSASLFSDRVPAPPRFFTGRDDLLAYLAATAAQANAGVLTQTLYGMGGIGKTSIAAAFVYRQRHDFDVIWWVRAEEPAVLTADLAELADRVGCAVLDDQVATAKAACRWLEETGRPWLLVLDNAPSEAVVDRWLPKRGNGIVLITSRNANFYSIGDVVRVDVFADDDAERFLRKRVKAGNPLAALEQLDTVIDRLGGVPLALEQAAAWVERVPNRSFARFVGVYDDLSQDPFSVDTRPRGYEGTATTTWRVSINAACSEAALAGPLLQALSFFASDKVPCQWLRRDAAHPSLNAPGPLAVDHALDALHAYSLVRIGSDDTVTVHRVVQTVTVRSATADTATFAIHVLRTNTPRNPEDPANWSKLAAVVPHVLAAAVAVPLHGPEQARTLCATLNDVVTYQIVAGAVRESVASAKVAVDRAVSHLGAVDPERLRSRHNLALAYEWAGDLDHAITFYKAVMADRERVLGRQHPQTLESRHRLGEAYRWAGDLNRAIAMHEVTVADRVRVLGADHRQTLESRNALALSYEWAGDLGRAIPLHEVTLTDRERVLGPLHPHTLRSRNCLAGAYRLVGRYDEAIALHESARADLERILGPHHPTAIGSINYLAMAYLMRGDIGRAIPMHELAVAEGERVLGPDHPQTFLYRNNLAAAYQRAGRLLDAIPLHEVTATDCQRVLGPNHFLTIESKYHLAAACTGAGMLERAIELHEATLADCERVMRRTHILSLMNRTSLALAYGSAGNSALAIPLLEETLADCERAFGPAHPETKRCQVALDSELSRGSIH